MSIGASGSGPTRTDMYCHACDGTFVAELDFSIDGNHVVECPRCNHEHFRVIKKGNITGDRWDSKWGSKADAAKGKSTWGAAVASVKTPDGKVIVGSKTTTAALFLRDLWLNRTDRF